MENTKQKEPFAVKYSDYYEFDSYRRLYDYHIKLENYNNNEEWPLDNCLNCSVDLMKHPPSKTTHMIVRDNLIIRSWIASIFVFGAVAILALYMEKANMVAAVIAVSIAVIILWSFFKFSFGTKPIELYHCKKCGVLLYNKCPSVFTSTEPPKAVFSKLEQIPGFKLK